MKKLTKSSIVIGLLLLLLLGLGIWRIRAYEIIGPTRLYETETNRVFVFKNKKDRLAYHLSALFLGNQLDKADEVGVTTYMGQSKPMAEVLASNHPDEFNYTFRNEVVQVDGLRYPMRKGMGVGYPIEAGKYYALVLRQSIAKTDYQLDSGVSFSVLSGEEDEGYIELLEVSEEELQDLYEK